jgi:hypothetical protein
MNSTIVFAIVAVAAVVCGFFRHKTLESKLGRALVDVLLVAAAFGVVALFLTHNGFIGHSDIQPFPY